MNKIKEQLRFIYSKFSKSRLLNNRFGKNFLVIFLCIVVMIICAKLFRFVLYDDSTFPSRAMMHEFYQSENIDTLFVGSSHVYNSCVLEIMDEELGENTFNASSQGQFIDGSLAMVREAIKFNDIKHIYLELYYYKTERKFSERKQLTETYLLADYLKFSPSKIAYLLKASSSEHWFNSFIVGRRNFDKITDFKYIESVIKNKSTDNYKNYKVPMNNKKNEIYRGKGYIEAMNSSSLNWINSINYRFTIDVLGLSGSDWEISLKEIIKLCKKNDIELTLFCSPLSELHIASLENYQEYHNYISSLATQNGLEFYDFNLLSNDYLNKNNMQIFKDDNHLNHIGAAQFSHLFADVIKKSIDFNDISFQTVQDMLNAEEPNILGVVRLRNTDKCYIAANRNSLKYEILACPETGNEYYIKRFDNSNSFNLSQSEHGELYIKWYDDNYYQGVQIRTIKY